VLAGIGAQNAPPAPAPSNPVPILALPSPTGPGAPATPLPPPSGAPTSGAASASTSPPAAGSTALQTPVAPISVPPPPAPPVLDILPTLTAAPVTAQTPSLVAPAGPSDDSATVTSKNATDRADDNAADAATSAEAAALASALIMPGMYVPTLQAPATLATATATTTAIAALAAGDSDQSETAQASADSNAAFTLVTTDAANSVTPSAAPAIGSIWASGAQSGAATVGAADNTCGATAALNAAQATPLHIPTLHPQPASDAAPPAQLRAPLGSAAWTDQLGAQLTWMARHGQESGSLRVSPEHLGPVEVRIEMRDGTASVWFGAAHADTRSALEQSLPRLRELFATSGLFLADAGVARDAPRQYAKPVTPSNATNSAGNASVTISTAHVALSRSGLVDTYV